MIFDLQYQRIVNFINFIYSAVVCLADILWRLEEFRSETANTNGTKSVYYTGAKNSREGEPKIKNRTICKILININ